MKPGAGRQAESSDREVLAGLVERVTFHNPENGFCVLRTRARGHRELVTVVGHAAMVAPGEVDYPLRRVGERPHSWPAVPGALHPHCGTVVGRGHREISGLRNDPGHRPGLCPQAGPRVRREGVRCHRGGAGTAARGGRHREGAGEADNGCLGRAEGRAGDHGVPAQPWRGHGAGGADIPDLRRGRRGGDDGEPLPARPGHPRHRLRDGRCDRDEARHREDGHGPGV